MRSQFASRLEALSRIRGVVGAMVISESDGLVVDAILQPESRGDIIAALVAALYRRTRGATREAGLGSSGYLQLDAEDGRICATGLQGGELVLAAIAETGANVGMIRAVLMRDAPSSRTGARS